MAALAFAAGADPIEFRLRYVGDPRDADAIKAAAERAGWEPRTKSRLRTREGLMLGQGMAYTRHDDRRPCGGH